MSRLRNSPRVLKGAIIRIDMTVPIPTVIAFQYNPETMTRTLKPCVCTDSNKPEALRREYPPAENISLTAEFDATDALEVGDPIAVNLGIYPQLSALETLLFPPKDYVVKNFILSAGGVAEIGSDDVPMTLFVWGPKRVVPVRIDGLNIDETAYDDNLNPIQAKVGISMNVLAYNDFTVDQPGRYVYMAHHVIKEAMGLIGTAQSVVSYF